MRRKGFMQMSFAWIFALIVGAFILFLAFYVAGTFIGTEQKTQDAVVSKEIGILLSPLEIGFEAAKTTYLELPKRTRIKHDCSSFEPFGKQHIDVAEETLGSWSDTHTDLAFRNKYIFAKKNVQGKKFYLFDLPFNFPYKVADMIIITSSEDEYCFIKTPLEIEDKVTSLNLENVYFTQNETACVPDDVKVCFTGFCDVTVNVDLFYSGEVVKQGAGVMGVEGEGLMYAAIFSDPDIYECQLKRLMLRTKMLGGVYNQKAIFLTQRVCPATPNLTPLVNRATNFNDSRDLNPSFMNVVEDVRLYNERNERCRLW